MNIVHFATNDFGGAGLATVKMHNALIKINVNSYLIVKNKKSENQYILEFDKKFFLKKIHRRMKRFFNISKPYKTNKYYFPLSNNQSINNLKTSKLLKLLPYEPDILIFHWISGFINYKTIFEIQTATKAKIFIMMQDNEPLTGGCHYPWECKKYQNLCTNCPALKINKKLAEINFVSKKKYINLFKPVLLSGSKQDIEKAGKSALYKNQHIERFNAIVDKEVFFYKEKKGFKYPLKILFAAVNINEKRKGFQYLKDALDILSKKYNYNDIEVSIASKTESEIKLSFPTKMLGFLPNDKALAMAISNSDCFVNCSIEDSGPYILYLALMSGRAIVSFDVGCARNVIEHKVNGYIAKNEDPVDLARGMEFILKNHSKLPFMNEKSRRKAVENHSEEIATKQLIKIFNKYIGR